MVCPTSTRRLHHRYSPPNKYDVYVSGRPARWDRNTINNLCVKGAREQRLCLGPDGHGGSEAVPVVGLLNHRLATDAQLVLRRDGAELEDEHVLGGGGVDVGDLRLAVEGVEALLGVVDKEGVEAGAEDEDVLGVGDVQGPGGGHAVGEGRILEVVVEGEGLRNSGGRLEVGLEDELVESTAE